MLVTSIFSFSHNVFYPSQNKFQFFFVTFILLSASAFRLEQSRNLSFGRVKAQAKVELETRVIEIDEKA